jgi:hypothetical protein
MGIGVECSEINIKSEFEFELESESELGFQSESREN